MISLKLNMLFMVTIFLLILSGCGATNSSPGSVNSPSGNSNQSSNTSFYISGGITASDAGLSGVSVSLTGSSSNTSTTNESGSYSFSGVQNGTYYITPSKTGYTFSPATQKVTINGGNLFGQSFIASSTTIIGTYNISGAVSANGSGLAGVAVSVGSVTALTDANGNFTLSSLTNGSYLITPTKDGFSFLPTAINVSVNNAPITGQNFSAINNAPTNLTSLYSYSFESNNEGSYNLSQLCQEWGNPTNLAGNACSSWGRTLRSVNGFVGDLYDNESRVSIVKSNMNKFISVKYPVGSCGSKNTDGCSKGSGAQWLMPLDRNYVELYLSYRVQFIDGFNFVQGGKLPGLTASPNPVATTPPTGGIKPGECDGFSARYMWRSNGIAETYLYSPAQPNIYGEDLIWYNANGTPVQFIPGRWYAITQRLVMNTPGVSDGILEIWLDGVNVQRKSNIFYRGAACPALGTNQLYFSTFFGGNDDSWAATKDEYLFFDDFVISRP